VARGAVLIGDAIHVTNPTAGQGMTMAIEDAAALARHVGPALARSGSDADIDRALADYERDRRPKNEKLLRWSHWMSRFYAMPGLRGDWLRRQVFGLGGTFLGQALQKAIWTRVASRPIMEASA
jgi:2-polyprenyl-6-methoxyphenol hydroxylase-like FAD-dependent oxidoreductase